MKGPQVDIQSRGSGEVGKWRRDKQDLKKSECVFAWHHLCFWKPGKEGSGESNLVVAVICQVGYSPMDRIRQVGLMRHTFNCYYPNPWTWLALKVTTTLSNWSIWLLWSLINANTIRNLISSLKKHRLMQIFYTERGIWWITAAPYVVCGKISQVFSEERGRNISCPCLFSRSIYSAPLFFPVSQNKMQTLWKNLTFMWTFEIFFPKFFQSSSTSSFAPGKRHTSSFHQPFSRLTSYAHTSNISYITPDRELPCRWLKIRFQEDQTYGKVMLKKAKFTDSENFTLPVTRNRHGRFHWCNLEEFLRETSQNSAKGNGRKKYDAKRPWERRWNKGKKEKITVWFFLYIGAALFGLNGSILF